MKRYKAPRRKTEKRKLNQKLDLFVKAVMIEMHGDRCLRCGSGYKVAASHILPKGKYPRLRFEALNVIPLCFGCHLHWWHKNPIEARDWLDKKFPGRIEQLQIIAATARRVDAKELLIALESEKSQ
jgi:hypothetical protein